MPETDGATSRAGKLARRRAGRVRRARRLYEALSLPFLTAFLLHDPRSGDAYGLTWRRRARLVWRMYRTGRNIETGTSFRAHVAMAAKIFAIPPSVEGVIVECGAWKGGTTANLSLVADIVGRTLVVYDSFEGLPEPAAGDRWAHPFGTGAFKGELDEVIGNVTRYGVIERCDFRKGWFQDTLTDHREPIVTAFLEVDYQDSLHVCVLNLWPHLIEKGWLFIDEYTRLDFCALFFSERWWARHFDRPPPGLLGAGTGIAVGQYFLGPYGERPPLQGPNSVGLTRKDFYGMWDYVPADSDEEPAPYSSESWTTTARLPAQVVANKLRDVDSSGSDGADR